NIDFDRAVDGRYLRIGPDNGGIVHVVDVQHNNPRIVVHEIVQFTASKKKGGNRFTRILPLMLVGDDAFFNQGQDAVRKHFSVNTKFAVIGQASHDSIGY